MQYQLDYCLRRNGQRGRRSRSDACEGLRHTAGFQDVSTADTQIGHECIFSPCLPQPTNLNGKIVQPLSFCPRRPRSTSGTHMKTCPQQNSRYRPLPFVTVKLDEHEYKTFWTDGAVRCAFFSNNLLPFLPPLFYWLFSFSFEWCGNRMNSPGRDGYLRP